VLSSTPAASPISDPAALLFLGGTDGIVYCEKLDVIFFRSWPAWRLCGPTHLNISPDMELGPMMIGRNTIGPFGPLALAGAPAAALLTRLVFFDNLVDVPKEKKTTPSLVDGTVDTHAAAPAAN